jgi:hypothetical protein
MPISCGCRLTMEGQFAYHHACFCFFRLLQGSETHRCPRSRTQTRLMSYVLDTLDCASVMGRSTLLHEAIPTIIQFSLPPAVTERRHGVDSHTLFSTVNGIFQPTEGNRKHWCRSMLYAQNRVQSRPTVMTRVLPHSAERRHPV